MLSKESLKELELHEGACKALDFVHNGGWYNTLGEKIGWGDLSPDDFARIQEKLEPGEAFVVLPESASFWNFVTRVGMIGQLCEVKPEEANPGAKYLAEHVRWIIANQGVFCCSDYHRKPEDEHQGVRWRNLNREEAKSLLEGCV